MKNRLLIPALICAAITLNGCHSDDAPETPSTGTGISFSAVVPNGSRVASTTTASIKDFVVYAFTDKSVLMDGVKVTREGGVWTYSPEAYWPVSPVNFYAFSPDITGSPNITGGNGGNIPGYVSDGKVDLLYSVKKDVMQQAAPVLLNFRHALSRVSVLMSSTNQRIKVKVSHILLKNIYLQGTFNFPEQSTLPSMPDVVGSWIQLKNLNNMMIFYAIDTENQAELTPAPTDYTENNLDCSFFIPQPLVDVQLSGNNYTGTYIQVDCQIFDTATGAQIWPNAKTPDYLRVPETECGRIVYAASSDNVKAWLPGHAYIYNIAINNPDVLDKIEFDVTVDDYSIDQM